MSDLVVASTGRTLGGGACAVAGRSRERIEKLLVSPRKKPCVCRGARPCFQGFRVPTAVGIARAFWAIEPGVLNVLLHSMYLDACQNRKSAKVKWCIGSSPVCFPAAAAILGTSTRTLRRYYTGAWSPKVPGMGRPRNSSMLVDFFFASLYTSAAEPLGRDHLEEQKIKEATVDPDYSHPDNPWMDEVPDFIVSWNPDRPPVELHAQLAALANNPGADIGLPVRYLGHAPLVHYYWLFHSHWDSLHAYSTFAHEGTFEEGSSSSGVLGSSSAGALPCPSMRLFKDRWKSVWRHYLRIVRKWPSETKVPKSDIGPKNRTLKS